MSKYHPIDVRHPNNRARERKSYLLDPPSKTLGLAQEPTRETKRATTKAAEFAPSGGTKERLSAAARAVAERTAQSPWGGSTPRRTRSAPQQRAEATTTARGGRWKWVVLLIAIVALVRSGSLDEVLRFFGF